MARRENERPVQVSLLDRLLDDEPGNTQEAPITREKSLAILRASVKRDLEWLLNTIRIADAVAESCTELQNSIWLYGFPDINSMSLQNTQDEQRLLRNLERTIEQFEPRLKRVRVTSYERISKARQKIEFHVEAMLMIDPMPERISFDTVLSVAKGEYQVKD